MQSTKPYSYLTPEEYLAFERQSEERHEYRNGYIFPIPAATYRHDFIVGNCFTEIGISVRGTRCTVFTAAIRVRLTESRYTYPDISVVCGEAQFLDEYTDTILNPITIVEVLSPSTESNDRGRKSMYYRNLPSLREYIIVAQDEPLVTVHRRLPDGTWTITDIEGLDGILSLPAIGCALPLKDIYRRVSFPSSITTP